MFFFFYCPDAHPDLHSFPTRRSSDLIPMVVSPFVGFALGYLVMLAVLWIFRRGHPGKLNRMIHSTARDRKSTRLNSSHVAISYAVFCLKKKKSTTYAETSIARSYDDN